MSGPCTRLRSLIPRVPRPLSPGVTGGPSSRVCVLLAGLPGDLASAVAKQLSAKGVDYTHILFSDYF